MNLDPAVTKLLNLDPDKSTISSGSGGCSSASSSKIVSTLGDGTEKTFFMKSGKGKDAQIMFEGEHASLNAIHVAVPSLAPPSFGTGQFSSSSTTYFLVTDYIHLTSRSSSSSSAPSLAAKLAKLHTTPAPVPEGYEKPVFGFPVTTCCGDTPQDNSYNTSWAEFYATSRLRFILQRAEKTNGKDSELYDLVEKTASKVVPRLIGDDHLNSGSGVTPVVVHGDLWSGNAGVGTIGSQGSEPEHVAYDPSSCYAHNEYELGIMKMFGGFGGKFLKEYHELCPKTEPVEEYEDRVKLYELYHHLNHYALFGGGYRSGAMSIMRGLVKRYGDH